MTTTVSTPVTDLLNAVESKCTKIIKYDSKNLNTDSDIGTDTGTGADYTYAYMAHEHQEKPFIIVLRMNQNYDNTVDELTDDILIKNHKYARYKTERIDKVVIIGLVNIIDALNPDNNNCDKKIDRITKDDLTSTGNRYMYYYKTLEPAFYYNLNFKKLNLYGHRKKWHTNGSIATYQEFDGLFFKACEFRPDETLMTIETYYGKLLINSIYVREDGTMFDNLVYNNNNM